MVTRTVPTTREEYGGVFYKVVQGLIAALQSMSTSGIPKAYNPHAHTTAKDEPFVELRYRSTLCTQLVSSLLHVLSLEETLAELEAGCGGAKAAEEDLIFAACVIDELDAVDESRAVHASKGTDVDASEDPFGRGGTSKRFDEDSPVHGQQATAVGLGIGTLARGDFSAADLGRAKRLLSSLRPYL